MNRAGRLPPEGGGPGLRFAPPGPPSFAPPPTHRGWVTFKRALVGQFYAGVDRLLSRGEPDQSEPQAPTWRTWLDGHCNLDLQDSRALARALEEDDYEDVLQVPNWIDTPVPDSLWETYLDGPYAFRDSPEARALRYLQRLDLGNRPLTDTEGNPVGTVAFDCGTGPGLDSHLVVVEGALILPALQYRLRELGEPVEIRIHA